MGRGESALLQIVFFITSVRDAAKPQNLVTFLKGHVKIIFLAVIALSFPFLCSKLEQTLHKQHEQVPDMLVIFFLKKGIEIPKNAILCVRVVSDQL